MYHVLVVDDSLFMRTIIKGCLEMSEFEVIAEAVNGYEAVKMFRKYHPDLIFMDITMPKVSGIQALKVIKEYDSEAKVIMCSAMGQSSMILEALHVGADDFIIKPFTKELILAAARKMISEKTLNLVEPDVTKILDQNKVDFNKLSNKLLNGESSNNEPSNNEPPDNKS